MTTETWKRNAHGAQQQSNDITSDPVPHQTSNASQSRSGPQKRKTRRRGPHSSSRFSGLIKFCVVGAIASLPLTYVYVSHRILRSTSWAARTASPSSSIYDRSLRTQNSYFGSLLRTQSHQHPRVMGYYFDGVDASSYRGAETLDPNMIRLFEPMGRPEFTRDELRRRRSLTDSQKYNHGRAEQFETDDCKAMYDWQKTTFVTCNLLMETDLSRLGETSQSKGNEPVRLMANGYWRDVWQHKTSEDLTVLKTLRYMHDDSMGRNLERHRRDGRFCLYEFVCRCDAGLRKILIDCLKRSQWNASLALLTLWTSTAFAETRVSLSLLTGGV